MDFTTVPLASSMIISFWAPAGASASPATGLAMLFISHNLDVVEYICDQVVVLYLNKVMEIAPASHRLLQGDLPSPADPPSGCVFRTRCFYVQKARAETVPQLQEVAPGR